MQGKIAFEEHMAIPETVAQARSFAGDSGRWDDFALQLMDVGARRDVPCAERPARPSLAPEFYTRRRNQLGAMPLRRSPGACRASRICRWTDSIARLHGVIDPQQAVTVALLFPCGLDKFHPKPDIVRSSG